MRIANSRNVLKIKMFLDYALPSWIKSFIRSFIYFFKFPNVKIRGNARISLNVKFGKDIRIGESCIISGSLKIGDWTFINDYCRVDSSVTSIGKFCSISHNVKLGLRPHPVSFLSTNSFFYSALRNKNKDNLFDDNHKGNTIIGNDVFIAANAIILSGVKVSDGAVISAGSVVTKDVPPFAIVGGIPARIIKYRFCDETIRSLLESEWWHLPIEKLSNLGESVVDINSALSQLKDE